MHELSITQSVIDAVSEKLGDAPVAVVTLEIGQLSGVVADSVRFCFELCSAGTTLDGARLDIIDTPGLGHCRSCDAELPLRDLILLCPCGSADVDVLSGQQLTIKSVEVR